MLEGPFDASPGLPGFGQRRSACSDFCTAARSIWQSPLKTGLHAQELGPRSDREQIKEMQNGCCNLDMGDCPELPGCDAVLVLRRRAMINSLPSGTCACTNNMCDRLDKTDSLGKARQADREVSPPEVITHAAWLFSTDI